MSWSNCQKFSNAITIVSSNMHFKRVQTFENFHRRTPHLFSKKGFLEIATFRRQRLQNVAGSLHSLLLLLLLKRSVRKEAYYMSNETYV